MASKAGGKAADRRAAPPGSARREPEGHIRMYSGEGCLLTLCSFRGPILRHNAQVLIALGEPPLVLGAGRSAGAGGLAAVRPFTELRFDGNGGPFACIDILPTHPAWRVFQQIAGDGVMWLPPERYGAWIRRLREFHRGHMNGPEAYRLFRRGIDIATCGLPEAPPVDPRVAAAVWRLYHEPGLSLEQLARQVGLSPDRLSHLFSRQMGMPVRRYVLAVKVMLAGRYHGSSRSLTEIAAACGFTDLAHFSKAWRRCYGRSPFYYFNTGAIASRPLEASGSPVLWTSALHPALQPAGGACSMAAGAAG